MCQAWADPMKMPAFTSSLAPAVVVLVACAAQPADGGAAAVQGQRLIARTAADWPSVEAFAQRAAEVAGVPVSEASALAPRQFSFLLVCDDAAVCQGALRRLSGERAFVLDVQADQRRRLPSRPGSAPSQ
jgi:hypothetical protein